jgi:hypothetical protein
MLARYAAASGRRRTSLVTHEKKGGIPCVIEPITTRAAIKDERPSTLAACGGLAILDRCARRDVRVAGNPARTDRR